MKPGDIITLPREVFPDAVDLRFRVEKVDGFQVHGRWLATGTPRKVNIKWVKTELSSFSLAQ